MQRQCCVSMANNCLMYTKCFIKLHKNKTKKGKHRNDMSFFLVQKMGSFAFLKHDTIMLSFFNTNLVK